METSDIQVETVVNYAAKRVPTMEPVFGCGAKRFGPFTGHPLLDPLGQCGKEKDKGCDPCLYSPRPMNEVYRINKNNKTRKDIWRRKVELEDWSKNLGYRNQRVLAYRRWQASLLGPAWSELPPFAPCYEPACKNVSFGRIPRFVLSKARAMPGPGTYYDEKPFKAPYGPHSVRPTFERDEPCRFKSTVPSWYVACTRYNIVDKDSISMKPKKVVSLKGPYELFSGKRDGPLFNHFDKSNVSTVKSWPLALPGSFEKFKSTHLGEMNSTGRDKPPRHRVAVNDPGMALRGPDDPGPAHYDVDKPRKFKQNKYGFNSSYSKGCGYVRQSIWPGVGRYLLRRPSHCGVTGQGHRHVFLSKVKRSIGGNVPEKMNTF